MKTSKLLKIIGSIGLGIGIVGFTNSYVNLYRVQQEPYTRALQNHQISKEYRMIFEEEEREVMGYKKCLDYSVYLAGTSLFCLGAGFYGKDKEKQE